MGTFWFARIHSNPVSKLLPHVPDNNIQSKKKLGTEKKVLFTPELSVDVFSVICCAGFHVFFILDSLMIAWVCAWLLLSNERF